MIHHSAVSLDYLESLLAQGQDAGIGEPEVGHWPLERQRESVAKWRALGLHYAPACDHTKWDGQCAGHKKED